MLYVSLSPDRYLAVILSMKLGKEGKRSNRLGRELLLNIKGKKQMHRQ